MDSPDGEADASAAGASSAASAGTRQAGDAQADSSGLSLREFDLSQATEAQPTRLQAGDRVQVSIWGYPELNHVTEIHPNGTITLPLIGELGAAGLSPAELKADIESRLSAYDRIEDQQLRLGDTLTLKIWQHPELDHLSVIEPDGMVTLPLAGRLDAAGRTVEEITAQVTERIRVFIRDAEVTLIPTFANRRFLQDYQVSVLIQQLAPRQVAVIGQVGLQGLVPIPGSLQLLEALAMSQVNQITADLNSVVVIRDSTTEQPRYQQLRVKDFLAGKADNQNIYLQNGDIVIVPMTTITRVGVFVDQFFARTMPIFTWWTAMHASSVARDSADTVELINESLRRGLLEISPSP